jgi:hypothetical protein
MLLSSDVKCENRKVVKPLHIVLFRITTLEGQKENNADIILYKY